MLIGMIVNYILCKDMKRLYILKMKSTRDCYLKHTNSIQEVTISTPNDVNGFCHLINKDFIRWWEATKLKCLEI